MAHSRWVTKVGRSVVRLEFMLFRFSSSWPGIAREDGRKRPFARPSTSYRAYRQDVDARHKAGHDEEKLALQFLPHDRGARHHRLHLSECDVARQVLQPAVRRHD